MKWKTYNKLFLLLFTVSLALGSCTEKEEILSEEITAKNLLNPNSEKIKAVVQVGIPGSEVDSRMSYDYTEENGKKAIKLLWDEDDAFTMNIYPVDTDYAYDFHLTEGSGSKRGTFVCENFYGSYFWNCLLYFPSSKVRCEKDYLSFSYLGQVQKGNDNLDHLKDYHTIRVDNSVFTDEGQYFDESLISFVGDNVEESSSFKFNLTNLPEIVPVSIDLMYKNPNGAYNPCFYLYNVCPYYTDGSYTYNTTQTHKLTLGLEEFEKTTSITAYMMLSNATVNLEKDGALWVCVTDADGKKYYCEKKLQKDASLVGGRLNAISCQEWEEQEEEYDAIANPDNGIVVLQEATKGTGTDIFIMGDGFSSIHFGENGNYDAIMRQAYADFFSAEPYASLKDYFNVYYINAVSVDEHDAVPYWSGGAQNGATMGNAKTVFNTQLEAGTTSISGDNAVVLQYAMQAIRYKGGAGGTKITDENEIYWRAYTGLSMVMVNVPCYAGTCTMAWSNSSDYGSAYSIAYTTLGNDGTGEQARLTTIHEAGGHGFGKLADEYGGWVYNTFNTSVWNELSNHHMLGVKRNVNEYWTEEEASKWNGLNWPFTSPENVYWAELLKTDYRYVNNEGLSIYKGGNTFNHMFCRSTDNSMMNWQFGVNGQYFNAISRWAIWYRLMRLTNGTSVTDFKESLDEFISFDSNIPAWQTNVSNSTSSGLPNYVQLPTMPLGKPNLVEGTWVNGRFVEM